MHERQLMYLHASQPWSCRDAHIKVRERFQCRKFSVCVSLWQAETLKPAQASRLGTDINLTLAMFHLALTTCDTQGVALKRNTNHFPISSVTLSNLGLGYRFLGFDNFLGKKWLKLKEKFWKKLGLLSLSYWAFWTNRWMDMKWKKEWSKKKKMFQEPF